MRSVLPPEPPTPMSKNGRSMGLLVDSILDIVEEQVVAGEAQPGTGVRGSAVIQNKVTDIVDVVELVRSIDPTFFLKQEFSEVADSEAGAK